MTSQHATLDEVSGRLPITPGNWVINPSHSSVAVACRLILGQTKGAFRSFSGRAVIAEDPTRSTVEVSIDTTSFDTGSEPRDQHLRGPDFLDVEHHPTVTFRSTALRPVDERRWRLVGNLTFLGVTQPVELDLQVHGMAEDLFGNTTAWFSANTELSRKAYGLDWNAPLPAGGLALGDRVKVDLEVELHQERPDTDQVSGT